jgi:hypothetical protein
MTDGPKDRVLDLVRDPFSRTSFLPLPDANSLPLAESKKEC